MQMEGDPITLNNKHSDYTAYSTHQYSPLQNRHYSLLLYFAYRPGNHQKRVRITVKAGL